MGRCSSKLTTIHSIRQYPLKNKFQTSQDKMALDQPEQDNVANNPTNRTPRNMVLPNSRRFDINYTAIPNKIHKKLTGWDNQVFGLVGLNNLGNTCFMNSALQCLLNIVPLADYFLSDLHQQEINVENFLGSKGEVVSAFASLVKQVWENNQLSEISPKEFYSAFAQFAPQFSYGTQEDSHDFLAILLDVIHEDLNRVKQRPVINDSDPQGQTLQEQAANAWKNHLLRNRSIIVDLFQSQIKSSLKCHECGFVSYKFEPYMYLSLPIPEESKKQLSLYDCLDEFIKEEKLDKEERWHCPKCKAPKDSSKKIEIWNVPNILIIHLKRFKFTRHKRGKIRSVVDFPVNDLDLSNYLQCEQKDKPLYDLFAISCHEGTLGGGHYTSYVKNRDTNSWYFFNDSFVKEMDTTKAQIVDSSGYVLFYSKTSVDVFARQTISDPAAWPHFQFASRKGSENETIMQSEHSILAETPQRVRKGSVRKIAKPQKKQSVLELYEPQPHPQQVMSNRTPSSSQKKMFMQREFEHNMQINNIDLSGGHDLERSVNNLDLNFERPTLQKKRSKAKQAVLVLPKDKDTLIMDENHFPKSSPEKKINIIGIEVKTTMQARYEIDRDQDVSEGFTPPKGVYVNKTQSYYQMDFTQDINEQYQAKPIFGINPKFKLGGLRNETKSLGLKP